MQTLAITHGCIGRWAITSILGHFLDWKLLKAISRNDKSHRQLMTVINALEKPLLQIASKLYISFMADFDKYLVPYLLSQGVSFVLLFAASHNTKVARALFALMFLGGSVTNLYNGIMQPEVYLEYGKLALPFYRDFINGWFSHITYILIPLIALGQLAIGIGILLKGSPVKWACKGAIIFFIGIAPLMIGSAFPFSVTVSVATLVILARDDYEYLWRKRTQIRVRTT